MLSDDERIEINQEVKRIYMSNDMMFTAKTPEDQKEQLQLLFIYSGNVRVLLRKAMSKHYSD